MARATRITNLGSAQGHAAVRALLSQPADLAIDARGVDRAMIMLCPDGCGDILTINLDPRAGKAWRLRRTVKDGLTLYPSVWRDDGCGAHFILWRDCILWCDADSEHDVRREYNEQLSRRILEALAAHPDKFLEAEEIGATVDASPWEVIWAATELVREGKATSRRHSCYKIKPQKSDAKS